MSRLGINCQKDRCGWRCSTSSKGNKKKGNRKLKIGAIPELLYKAVLFARLNGERIPSGKPFDSDKWYCTLSDEVNVTFDGHPDSDEDGDVETFIVAFFVDSSHMSFFVDIEGCLGSSPTADLDYAKERFQEDLESQAEAVSLSPKEVIKFVEASLNELKI